MSNPPHPSTKPTSMAIQLKTGNERRVSGFGFCNWKPEIRNSEPSLQATISPKTAAYSLRIFTIASMVSPHKLHMQNQQMPKCKTLGVLQFPTLADDSDFAPSTLKNRLTSMIFAFRLRLHNSLQIRSQYGM
jgi:hypothetical protein